VGQMNAVSAEIAGNERNTGKAMGTVALVERCSRTTERIPRGYSESGLSLFWDERPAEPLSAACRQISPCSRQPRLSNYES
jgi:hypothetical protein